ncbi:MAG: anthranilate synthase component I [Xanthomonadales bacterium PRO7]|mgnify:FL=1|jgi:anthranilate synthase component 1|nr:anthranilate synthase component I [Xanthomonadales bacterium PRO7]HMM56405.1 anthranilate synthase component I [Rudaea sp.]
MISQDQFAAFAAQGHNRIPVVREVLSDLDTPLSVYLKLADGPFAYLFESVEGGARWGRYSIIGLPARRVIRVFGKRLVATEEGEIVDEREVADPLAEIAVIKAQYRVPSIEGLPKFAGGLVGYFGYECASYLEPKIRADAKPDQLGMPDICLMLAEELAVFDNLKGKLYLIVNADPGEPRAYTRAQRRLDSLVHRLRSTSAAYPDAVDTKAIDESHFVSSFPKNDYLAAVEKAKEHVFAGDVFQVQISQRLSVPFRARPLDVYRALRALNPSPYMYFIDLGQEQIIGSSPEILVRAQGGQVVLRPIAGTRRRGHTPQEDAAMEAELLADPKERAEHVMLIDLGRNDVGRVAQTGSVELTANMIVERYSHVMHIVSEVIGKLKPGLNFMDVFRATFPAGTLTGAPKVRAMQVIAELETVKRGVYGGAVGYWGWNDEADLAIAIRTAIVKNGELHVQAAGGVVADSVPELEWKETMNKCRALFRAVQEAVGGL